MSCARIRRELGVRSVSEFDELAEHLDACPACAEVARRITEEERAMYRGLTEWVDGPAVRASPQRPWGWTALIAAAAALTLWLVGRPPPEQATSAVPGPEEEIVAMAVRELQAGAVIGPDDVVGWIVARDYVLDTLVPARQVVGGVVTSRVLPGEWVRGERVRPGPVRPVGFPVDRPAESDTVMVAVAARAVPPGRPIDEASLYEVQMPLSYVVEGMYLSPVGVLGVAPCEEILANEFIRGERLVDPTTGKCRAR